jgi:hypothetical protein
MVKILRLIFANDNSKQQESKAMEMENLAEYKAVEMEQLSQYKAFVDKGKCGISRIVNMMIRCHLLYDVKHDGWHKSQLVTGSNLTDPNTESIYYRVV